jgi:hypothetical protein
MKVKVFNDDTREYRETFRGDDICIPAGGFIMMERAEAIAFKGQWCPIIEDGNKNKLNAKKIRIEDLPIELRYREKKKFVSNFNGMQFDTEEELNAHYASLNNVMGKSEPKTTTLRVYVCEKCDAEFMDKAEHSEHVKGCRGKNDASRSGGGGKVSN